MVPRACILMTFVIPQVSFTIKMTLTFILFESLYNFWIAMIFCTVIHGPQWMNPEFHFGPHRVIVLTYEEKYPNSCQRYWHKIW